MIILKKQPQNGNSNGPTNNAPEIDLLVQHQLKHQDDGKVEMFKAKLVTKDFTQKEFPL